MFPPPEFVEMCVEHREVVNGLWEKKGLEVGDWADNGLGPRCLFNVPAYPEFATYDFQMDDGDLFTKEEVLESFCWLPRPDQLVEMLEERGYTSFSLKGNNGHYSLRIPAPPGRTTGKWSGPDPACVLLKCLLAVTEKEEPCPIK